MAWASTSTTTLRLARRSSGVICVETVLMLPTPELSYVSSSLIKEIVRGGGDVSPYLTDPVALALRAALGHNPRHASAYYQLAKLRNERLTGEEVRAVRARLADPACLEALRPPLLFALGCEAEKDGEPHPEGRERAHAPGPAHAPGFCHWRRM